MTSIEADLGADEDLRLAIFKEPYVKSESWKDLLNMVNSRVSQMIIQPKQWKSPSQDRIVRCHKGWTITPRV